MSKLTRNQKMILLLALAFFIPVAVGLTLDIQYNAENPQRSWFWHYEITGGSLVKYFPEPIDYTYPTISYEDMDRSFWFYESPTYSRSLKSYDGGPITIEAGDNPFADQGSPRTNPYSRLVSVEPADTFTFGDVYDNLAWFVTDWRPLQWVSERLSFFDPSTSAFADHAGNHFATFGEADCTSTTVATDAGCWAQTSGGTTDALPGAGDNLIFDGGGTTSGSMGASLSITTGTVTFCSGADAPIVACDTGAYTGTFTIDSTFVLTNTGTFVHDGGTIAITGTGGFDSGAFTLNSAGSAGVITLITSAAVLSVDGLTITGGTFNKGTATLTVTGTLTMDGGDLVSTSGNATVSGATNISNVASAIDFGSETWTLSGDFDCVSTDTTVWEAGSGTVIFDDADGDASFTPCAITTEAHFSSVTFDSTVASQTWTMATNALQWSGTLTVADATLATTDLGLSTGALVVGTAGVLTANASTVAVTSVTMTGGTSGVITVTSGGWTVSGSWDTSGASSTYTQGTGIVEFDGTGTITMLSTDAIFDDLTISANTVTMGSVFTVTNDLTVSGGTFAISTFEIDVLGNVILSGGSTTIGISAALGLDVAGNLTMSGTANITMGTSAADADIDGNVDIQGAGNFIDFGSGTWNVGGNWTNASTSASWDDGTGTMLFDSATGGTMTFAGANLSEAEFNNVTFDSTGTTQTFTMATRALRWDSTLTVSDAGSTTTLATADLGLSTGALVIGNGGILTANASTVAVTSVTMAGGTSGILTLTTGAWSVSSSWNTSGAGSTFTQGTSTITFDAAATITLLSTDDDFYNLTISAGVGLVVTAASSIDVLGAMVISGGTFAKGTQTLDVTGSLTMSGGDFTSTSGDVTIGGLVNISSTASAIDFGSETWTISSDWSNQSTDSAVWDAGTGTIIFDSSANINPAFAPAGLGENEFNNLTWQSASGTAAILTLGRALQIAGTLTISDTVSTSEMDVSGSNFNITADIMSLGAGGILDSNATSISISGNWASTAGTFIEDSSTVTFSGTGNVDGETFFNLNNASGTRTLTGGMTVSNNFTIPGGVLAKGTNTFDVTLNMTVNGGAITSTSGNITVGGNVNISSSSSYIDLGSESWTVSGTWTNASIQTIWDAGTGTITFDSATGGTMTFAGTNLAEDEFNNVTFTSSAGTAQVFTMATRGLRLGGTLTISDGTSTTELDTSASNLAITTGSLTIGANGILDANVSTITVATTWDSNNASAIFTFDTSTVVMNGATVNVGSVDTINRTFYNLTLNAASSTIGGVAIARINNVLTIGGSGSYISGDAWLYADSPTVSLVNSGTIAASAGIRYVGTADIVGTTYGILRVYAGITSTNLLSGNVITQGLFDITSALSVVRTVNLNGFNLTVGGNMEMGILSVGRSGVLIAGNNTVSVSGNVNIATVDTGGSYITSGASGSWTVSGSWTSGATSGSWNFDAPITFDSASSVTMTFGAVTQEFDGAVTFNSTSASPVVFTMATNALNIGGTLTISDGTSTTELNTSGSNLAITAGAITIDTGGILDANASTVTVNGNYTSTNGSTTWTTGATIIFAAAATVATLTNEGFRSLTINDGISVTFASGNPIINEVATFGGASAATLTIDTSVILSRPATDGVTPISGAGITFVGTGRFSWNGTADQTVAADDYGNVDLQFFSNSASTTKTMNGAVTTTGLLAITDFAAGRITILDTGGFALTVASITLGSVTLDATSSIAAGASTVTVSGNVLIESVSPSSSIDFGSSSWTVSGTWTNNTTTASWNAGSATMLFDSATGGTMTFAGANLAEDEFNDVTFTSSAGTAQIFTMATNGLRLGGRLDVLDGTSTTELDTANLAITVTGILSIGVGGILDAGSSTITVGGTWSATGDFQEDTSTVDFTGGGNIAGVNTFWNLTISGGSRTTTGADTVSNNMLISGGTFAKGTQTLDITGSLTMSGGDLTSTSGNVTTGLVNISSALSAINFGSENWTMSGSWTNASTDGAVWNAGTGFHTFDSAISVTMTFAPAGLGEDEFNNITFTSSAVTAVIFTMATNALSVTDGIVVTDGGAAPNTTELDTAGLAINTAGDFTMSGYGILDAGASTITIGDRFRDLSANADLQEDTSTFVFTAAQDGSGEMPAEAYFNVTVSGSTTMTGNSTVGGTLVLSGGTFAKGTTTLDVTGALTMSGGDFTSTSGDVTTGLVNISSASSAIDFGSEAWTVSGTWTNASTDSTVWEVGTGTILFDSATGGTMTFAPSLGEAELFAVTFTSSAATAQTFTLVNNLHADAGLTIADSSSTTTLDIVTYFALSASLAINAGGVVTTFFTDVTTITTDSGEFGINPDTLSIPGGESRFDVCATSAGIAVTFTFSGLNALATYRMWRNDILVADADANASGTWTTTVTAGWDLVCTSDAMIFQRVASGGGGGGGGGEEPKPYFEWENLNIGSGLAIGFTDTSTLGTSFAITKRVWLLGDGAVRESPDKTFIYVYRAPGDYTVRLTLYGLTSGGQELALAHVERTVTVAPPPGSYNFFNWWADFGWIWTIILFVGALANRNKKLLIAAIISLSLFTVTAAFPQIFYYIYAAFPGLPTIPAPPKLWG